MPFYSRHSNNASDCFFLNFYGEEDYFRNMIYCDSSFGSDVERHYDSSDADVIPTSTEEDKNEKTRKYQKEYHSKYFKEKLNEPYTCNICCRTLSNSSNIKRHEKSKKCKEARSNN